MTGTADPLQEAAALMATGDVRGAIDLLTDANRHARSPLVEQALVRVRAEGCALLPAADRSRLRPGVQADPTGAAPFEITPDALTADVMRVAFARHGCLLVRGLVPPARVTSLVVGIDAAFGAYDASAAGEDFDGEWYHPFAMPDLISPVGAGRAVVVPEGAPPAGHIPAGAHRRVVREGAGVWTVDSPPNLFALVDLVDELGLGTVMTEFLGERPLLSANKCTLRRVVPEVMEGGWHQDGAFLGNDVASVNVWIALTACGRDAPGLDLLPRRFDRILESGSEKAFFKWSLSDEDVDAASEGVEVVRPDFAAGDALLFDHRLVHRTGTSREMTRQRHAIESWWFAPSAFPASQLPLVY